MQTRRHHFASLVLAAFTVASAGWVGANAGAQDLPPARPTHGAPPAGPAIELVMKRLHKTKHMHTNTYNDTRS